MEYTALESLIPYKEDQTMKNEIDKKRGEPYKSALEEHNELIFLSTSSCTSLLCSSKADL